MRVLSLISAASCAIYFKETFDSPALPSNWVVSAATKNQGSWNVTEPDFYADKKANIGLKTTTDARFYAISSKFDKPLDLTSTPFVLQFSVKFEQNIDCGGGYAKIMPATGFEPAEFDGETTYNIMFGPDICGHETNKVHLIINYKGENKLITKHIEAKRDQLTHLYTLIITPEKNYTIFVDQEEGAAGSLYEDWDLFGPKDLPDPLAEKPKDWVEQRTIPDPESKMPADWVSEPKLVDEKAVKPGDWDDEMDGEWVRPMIDNPEYKGPWAPLMIPNPKFKGPWVAPRIPNPEYVIDPTFGDFTSGAIGFDLWQVKAGTVFDNIIVTDSLKEANQFADETWKVYKNAEAKALEAFSASQEAEKIAEEEAEKKAEDKEKSDAEEDKTDL